jgi:hypothetical protein
MSCLRWARLICRVVPVLAHGSKCQPRHGHGAGRARHGHESCRARPCLGRAFSGRARVDPSGLARLENYTPDQVLPGGLREQRYLLTHVSMWNVCTSVRQYALPARLAHAEHRERQPTWVWFGAPVVWLTISIHVHTGGIAIDARPNVVLLHVYVLQHDLMSKKRMLLSGHIEHDELLLLSPPNQLERTQLPDYQC